MRDAKLRENMPSLRENVRGIVLAGSYHGGSSLFDRLLRGPMVPVALEPVICHPLKWLRDGGVPRVTICANSSTAEVRGYLGSGESLSMQLEYYEDHAPRGAAGCVRDAGRRTDTDTFVVVEGAVLPSVSIDSILETHRRSGAIATVAVETDRRRNAMTSERPPTPGGVYVFDRVALESISATGFQDIKESLLERLYRAGKLVVAHSVVGVAPRVVSHETYVSINAWRASVLVAHPELLVNFVPIAEGMRHRTAWIDPRARVVGPVLIGPHAQIFAGAVLVAPTIVGAGSQVHRDATVSRSILWDGCLVSERATVDRALLADNSIVQKGENFKAAMRLPDADRGRWVSISAPWRIRWDERTSSTPDLEVPLPGLEGAGAHFDSEAIAVHRASADRRIAATL